MTDEEKKMLLNLKKDYKATEFEKTISESISDSLDELSRMEEKGSFLLYLWIATARGTTLREAIEQYTIRFERGLNGDLRSPSIETNCTLQPREKPIILNHQKFADYQMRAAKFLQDMIDEISKKKIRL